MGGVQRAMLRCSASNFNVLVVNLRDVEAMDSDGVSALYVAYFAARSLGSDFYLEDVPARLEGLLASTGFNTRSQQLGQPLEKKNGI
jgi:anti-anti-sigma factor